MKKILCFVLSIMMLTALFAAPVTAGASAPVPEKKLVTSLTMNRSVEAWAYDVSKTAEYDETDGTIDTYKGKFDSATGIFTIPVPKGYKSKSVTQGDGCTLELGAADISAYAAEGAKTYIGFKIKGNAYPTAMNPNLRSSGGRAYLSSPYYVMNELVPNEWNEVYIPLSDYVYEDNFDKTALYRIRFTIGKGSETEKINMELKDFGIYISAEEANKFEITDFKITVNSAVAETYSADDVLTFSANAKNTTASDVDFVVVAATYDKLGNINSAKLFNMKSVASTGKIAGDTAQITAASEDATVRAFCWSGVSDLTPLAPVQSAAKNQ